MSERDIDIRKIMDEIKADIAVKGLVNDIPAFDGAHPGTPLAAARREDGLRREVAYLKQHEVHYYREITSFHRAAAPAVRSVKRLIRKLCKFIGEPMVDEINDCRIHTARALEHTIRSLEAMEGAGTPAQQIEEHRYKQLAERYATENYRLERELSAMRLQLQALQNDCAQMKARFDDVTGSAEG